jgi:galactonate dehydratase
MIDAMLPFRPFFIEEPTRPENIDALALLRAKSRAAIATGESLYTKFQFRNLIASEAADIIQPDVCAAGGLLEMKKIAAIAEAAYVSVAPHNPMGPVATAVNLHFAASTPNFLILEYKADDAPPRSETVDNPMRLVDGYLELPDRPGFGVELNEDIVEKFPPRRWHRPFPFGEDGSMGLI